MHQPQYCQQVNALYKTCIQLHSYNDLRVPVYTNDTAREKMTKSNWQTIALHTAGHSMILT